MSLVFDLHLNIAIDVSIHTCIDLSHLDYWYSKDKNTISFIL